MVDLALREPAAAFHGDGAIKGDLLAALEQGVGTPLSATGPEAAETSAWAGRVGLPAALVLIAAHLGRGAAADDLSRDLVMAIEPGAAVVASPHRLVLWAWEGAPEPLGAMLASAESRAAGAQAASLHRRAAEGSAIARGEWRAARASLGRLGQVSGEAGKDDLALAAAVMAACCWDYTSTPGAAVDMLSAWEGLVSEQLRRAEGWGVAEDERFLQLIRAERVHVLEDLGPEPTEGEEAAADHKRRLVEGLLERLNTSDNPLPARKAALNERIVAARGKLREQIGAALLGIVREPATVAVS